MNGHWSFEDTSVLSHFVGGMFPKLYRLNARAWDGVTVGSFVNLLRTTGSCIASTTIFLPQPSAEEEAELGVKPLPHVNYRRTADEKSNRLYISGREYVVRKEAARASEKLE